MTQNNNEIIIQKNSTDETYWRDIWKFRELLYILSWKDILVRYKQTAIGILWSVIRPVITVIIFSFIFGKLANFPSHGTPYPLLVFSGLMPWQLFSTCLNDGGNSLLTNRGMITKVYFPRMIVVFSSMMVCLVDFLIGLAVLGGVMVFYGFVPSWHIIFLPFFILLTLFVASGFALCLAMLNAKYRDFVFVIPFLLQLGWFISPIGFTSDVVPEKWQLLYSLNPMAGIIDGVRWSILGDGVPPSILPLVISIMSGAIVFYLGVRVFRRFEKSVVDLI